MRGFFTFILVSLGIFSYADQMEESYFYSHHISYLNMRSYDFISNTSSSVELVLHSNDINEIQNDNISLFKLIYYYKENKVLLADVFEEQKVKLDGFIQILLNHEYVKLPFDLYAYFDLELSESKFTEVKQLMNFDSASEEQFISETAAINLVLVMSFLSLIIHRIFLMYELKTRKFNRPISNSSPLF